MITLFIGIWLQPRNQPAFSVCQLPASGLASTFYSLKFPLFFPCPSPSSLLVSRSPPFCNKLIYLYPHLLPLSLSVCALISLGTQRQQTYAFSSQKNKTKNKAGTQNHTHLNTRAHTIVHLYARVYKWLFHVDYLGMSGSLDVIIQIFVYSVLPVSQYVVTEIYETKLIICASSHRTSKAHCSSQICTEDWISPLTWSEVCVSATLYVCFMECVCSWHKSMLRGGSVTFNVCLFACFKCFLLSSLTHLNSKRIIQYLPSRLSCWITIVSMLSQNIQ